MTQIPTEPRITNIMLDEDEMPAAVTIVLPMPHAAEIVHKFGALSGATGGNERTTDLYDCLSSLFNRFYDEGVSEYGA